MRANSAYESRQWRADGAHSESARGKAEPTSGNPGEGHFEHTSWTVQRVPALPQQPEGCYRWEQGLNMVGYVTESLCYAWGFDGAPVINRLPVPQYFRLERNGESRITAVYFQRTMLGRRPHFLVNAFLQTKKAIQAFLTLISVLLQNIITNGSCCYDN